MNKEFDEQEIENREHDKELKIKKVLFYGWDGTQAVALNIVVDKVGVTVG